MPLTCSERRKTLRHPRKMVHRELLGIAGPGTAAVGQAMMVNPKKKATCESSQVALKVEAAGMSPRKRKSCLCTDLRKPSIALSAHSSAHLSPVYRPAFSTFLTSRWPLHGGGTETSS